MRIQTVRRYLLVLNLHAQASTFLVQLRELPSHLEYGTADLVFNNVTQTKYYFFCS
jgi:hypothetical protein